MDNALAGLDPGAVRELIEAAEEVCTGIDETKFCEFPPSTARLRAALALVKGGKE